MKLLTVEEVADRLSVPPSWVYAHVKEIPHLKLGRYVRFEEDALEAWIKEQRVPPDRAT